MGKRLGQRLVESLEEAVAYEQGKITLRETTVELPAEPPTISAKEMAKIRTEVFHMSQPIFAKLLGVKPASVKAWEQGQNEPAGPVRRLLQVLLKHPTESLKEISGDDQKKIKVG